jgi:hypothetical protein
MYFSMHNLDLRTVSPPGLPWSPSSAGGHSRPARTDFGQIFCSVQGDLQIQGDLPPGTRDTLTKTHTHGFGVAICGIQRYFGVRGRCPEGHPQCHRRQLPRARPQHLQGLAPTHRPTDRRQTCLYVVHRCQGRPTLRNRLGCPCRVLHRSRPAPKVDDQDPNAGRPSTHQKSAFLHDLGRLQLSLRAKHGGIPRSCSPLSFLRSSPPTGSRSASTCRCSRFGKSGPRW